MYVGRGFGYMVYLYSTLLIHHFKQLGVSFRQKCALGLRDKKIYSTVGLLSTRSRANPTRLSSLKGIEKDVSKKNNIYIAA